MNELLPPEEQSRLQREKMVFPPCHEFRTKDVEDVFLLLDVDPASIEPQLIEIMQYLGSHSETMNDEKRARAIAGVIELHCNRTDSSNRLSEEGWRHVNLASTFSDVGKVGPEQGLVDINNYLITALYARRGDISPFTTLSEFIEESFPEHRVQVLQKILYIPGLSFEMTMRSFWDMHAQWTLDHLKDSGVSKEIVLTAAAHHLLEGDGANPLLDGVSIVDKATGIPKYLADAAEWLMKP